MFERIYHEFPRIKRITNDQGIRVYQTPSGESYPSVTTVTGLLAKEAIKKWRERVGKKEAARISTTASKRGTRIDFKTSSKVKKREHIHGYFMQCSAYAVAFEEITKVPVSNLVIIMTVAHDDCIIFEEKRDDWIGQFKELREEYRRSYHC